MAMLVLRKNTSLQQQHDLWAIDYANPASVGLTRAVIFGPAGPTPFDLVTSSYLTAVSTGFTQDVRENLFGIRNTNETSYWTMPKRTEEITAFSMAWVGIQDGGTSTVILRDNSSSGGSIIFWRNASQWDIRLGGIDVTQAGTFSQGKLYSAVVTGASGINTKLVVDGQTVIDASTAGAAGFAGPWYIHQNGSGAQGSLNTSFLLVMWDRCLSPAEAREFSLNPWQLLNTNSTSFMSYTVGGGGGSTTISGISLTSSLGTISSTADDTVLVSGISLTSNIGSITSVVSDIVSITGIGLTSSIGTITPLVDDTTTLTGIGITSNIGSITAAVNSTVSITGIGLTSSIGSITATVNSTVSITGIVLTSSIGNITSQVADAETLVGISASFSIGSINASAGGSASTTITGISITSSLSSISTFVDDTVSISGTSLTSGIGSITSVVSDTVSITGIGLTSSLGSISAFADGTVSVSGIGLTSSIGSLSTSVTDTTTLSGIGLTSSIGSILGLIDTGYTPSLRQYIPKLKYVTFNIGNKAHLTPNSGSRVFTFISPVRGIVKVASARTTTYTSGSRIT